MPTDFERGAKVAGSKFYFTIGENAMQEWKLINHMIETHVSNGYTFVIPPYLVRRQTAEFAGILPRFEGDFYLTTDDMVLIPTAETALVGMHAGEIIPAEQLPLKYVAFSPCFRREAGSAGKRDKGLRRVHQFHKIELFVICKPEQSEALHQEMRQQVETMLTGFGLVHRTIELPDHDRSPVSAKTYDVELRLGDEWLEVSSISNTLDRQSQPAQIRYKNEHGKNVKCHMLNGSGVALPRLLLAMRGAQLNTGN
jgi:seryl-tRNA synthetase